MKGTADILNFILYLFIFILDGERRREGGLWLFKKAFSNKMGDLGRKIMPLQYFDTSL